MVLFQNPEFWITIFMRKLFTALLLPCIAAYITSATCLRVCVWQALKARHPLYTMRSLVRSQSGRMKPWEVRAPSFAPLILPHHPFPAQFTPEVHWMMGNAVCIWQIWVDFSPSPPQYPLLQWCSKAAFLGLHGAKHMLMCPAVLEIVRTGLAEYDILVLCMISFHISHTHTHTHLILPPFPFFLLCLFISSSLHFQTPPLQFPSVSISHSWAAPADYVRCYVNTAANPSASSLTPTSLIASSTLYLEASTRDLLISQAERRAISLSLPLCFHCFLSSATCCTLRDEWNTQPLRTQVEDGRMTQRVDASLCYAKRKSDVYLTL